MAPRVGLRTPPAMPLFPRTRHQVLKRTLAGAAGADTFVAGSAVYNTADPVEAIANLRSKAQGATDASWWCGN